jgi:hypothetical protein
MENRDNMFEHYSGKIVHIPSKPEKQKATVFEKQCHDCRMWARRKGIAKEFWCKHMKHNLEFYRG